MENLFLEATEYTPLIDFNIQSGILKISGKSYPENTFEFYKPILNWVEEYFEANNDHPTKIILDLEYLNSSSLKAYFDLFDILEIAKDEGSNMTVTWLYDEDNDISQETGEDFASDFESLNMELVAK
jgi:hypothetical protein